MKRKLGVHICLQYTSLWLLWSTVFGQNLGDQEKFDLLRRNFSAEELGIDLNLVRYDATRLQFFSIGDASPCNRNMRFFADPLDEYLGRCDCDWYQCSRPLLYDLRSDQCYWAWSRGPCAESEWYIYGRNMLPRCEQDPCPEHPKIDQGIADFYFSRPSSRACLRAGIQGYCKGKDETLAITAYKPIPECRSEQLCYALSIPAKQLCIPGNQLFSTGNCHGEESRD